MTTSNRPLAGNRMTRLDQIVRSYPDASLDFIRTSFYLPVDVLQDERFKVEKIVVVSGTAFRQFVREPEASKCKIVGEGATPAMLQYAKQLGVSCRAIRATNERIMVVKLWYGNEAGAS